MKKWEHCYLYERYTTAHFLTADRVWEERFTDLDEQIANLGALGWEMVAVQVVQDAAPGLGGATPPVGTNAIYWFKRQSA